MCKDQAIQETTAVAPKFTKGQRVLALKDSVSMVGNTYFRNGDRGIITEVVGNVYRVNFDGYCGNSEGLVPSSSSTGGGWWVREEHLKAR